MVLKIDDLETRSATRQRCYVPCLLVLGSDLSRTDGIAMQLHRIDFRVEYRSMSDIITVMDKDIFVLLLKSSN